MSGSWFRGSGLATKSIPRTTHGKYDRYIMCTMVTGEVVSLKFLGEWSRGRVTLAISIPSDLAGRSEQRAHIPLNSASTAPPPFPRQALRRPNNHRHSFEPWLTDYRPNPRTSHAPPLPPFHHPQTTRPTTMTSSTNMLRIITRTQATKPSPSNPQPSPMPQPPNTVVAHHSLSTTRASRPSPTNPRAQALGQP